MSLTNVGKACCYISNWGNNKSNIGNTSHPAMQNFIAHYSPCYDKGVDYYNWTIYRGYPSTDHNFRDLTQQLLITLVGNYEGITDRSLIRYETQLQIIYEDSYNKQHMNVSYINPIIMHATITVQNLKNYNIEVTKVQLWGGAYYYYVRDTRWDCLATETLDTSVTLAPGDTATFTITVK